jgi:hypothetical protein
MPVNMIGKMWLAGVPAGAAVGAFLGIAGAGECRVEPRLVRGTEAENLAAA